MVFYGAVGPVWTPDGNSLIYRSLEHQGVYVSTIYRYELATKTNTALVNTSGLIYPGATITPDGKNMFFYMTFLGEGE